MGIGLSFVDNTPKELLFFCFYDLQVELTRWIECNQEGQGVPEIVDKLKLYLQHMQIDNMINQIMPVVLTPSKLFSRTDKLSGSLFNRLKYDNTTDSGNEEEKDEESKEESKHEVLPVPKTPFV